MTKPYPIILIAFATVIASLFGLVLIPNSQLAKLDPIEMTLPDGTKAMYPAELEQHFEAPGREHYRSLGCIYCHSQQVRPEGFGADIDRGWGSRRSVPLDYILQKPPFTGTSRTGPDLASIGQRQPSDDWHFLHLFDPTITSPDSTMSPFPFMFDEVTQDTSHAVALPEGYREQPTWIVPKRQALELVAYLKSLKQDHRLEDVNK